MKTFTTANLKITTVKETPDKICYILYPFDGLGEWIEEASQIRRVSIAVITGMDWDNDLTPWPAPGQPPGAPDFEGHAPKFLSALASDVIPAVERQLGISPDAERTLAGVSLSGLFTLWQWMVSDIFRNIISLSGSFWYEGFTQWLTAQPVEKKSGRAYFLLGNQEAHTKVKAFQTVQTDTEEIVAYLRRKGINDRFDLVAGNHYQHPIPRLDRALAWMYGTSSTNQDA